MKISNCPFLKHVDLKTKLLKSVFPFILRILQTVHEQENHYSKWDVVRTAQQIVK